MLDPTRRELPPPAFSFYILETDVSQLILISEPRRADSFPDKGMSDWRPEGVKDLGIREGG